jgi:hypothetical protein
MKFYVLVTGTLWLSIKGVLRPITDEEVGVLIPTEAHSKEEAKDIARNIFGSTDVRDSDAGFHPHPELLEQ